MITQGYLARHFQGRSGMRDPALLDVAQDYALKYLHDQGAFELGIVLKGGTSLPSEDIGLLTRPVEPEAWLGNVRARYAFVTALDDTEQRVALCNPGDRYEVSQLVLALTGDG